jgi:hypothetical protein
MDSKLDNILFMSRNIFNIFFGMILLSEPVLLAPVILITDLFYDSCVLCFEHFFLPLITILGSFMITKTKTPSFYQVLIRFLIFILSVGCLLLSPPIFKHTDLRYPWILSNFIYSIFLLGFSLYLIISALYTEFYAEKISGNKNDKPL